MAAGQSGNQVRSVSLFVVAQNEEPYLSHLLADIKAQDFLHQALEVLLIDSCSEDGTRQLMLDFAASERDFWRVQVLDNPGRYLPQGCNIALAAASGDVLVRIDAHARIPSDFVSRCVEVLEEGHEAVGGPRPTIATEPSAFNDLLQAAEESAFGASAAGYRRSSAATGKGHAHATGTATGAATGTATGTAAGAGTGAAAKSRGRAVNSLFHGAYRRHVFDVVGNYDERLLRTEDNDMSQRIQTAGFELWMDDRIYSEQYLRPSLGGLLRQKSGNAFWIGRTLWLKPRAIRLTNLVPLVFVLAIIAGLVLGFCLSWWPLIALAIVYAALALAIGQAKFWQTKPKNPWLIWLPALFCGLHLCYGAATLWGIVWGAFRRN